MAYDLGPWDGYEDGCIDEYYYEEAEPYDPLMLVCQTPGCVIPGEHFRSECMTAQDQAEYYAAIGAEAVPWRYREPWYFFSLIWDVLRYRTQPSLDELHWHWHVITLPRLTDPLRRLWPKKCRDCGRRWRRCPDSGCLPF